MGFTLVQDFFDCILKPAKATHHKETPVAIYFDFKGLSKTSNDILYLLYLYL